MAIEQLLQFLSGGLQGYQKEKNIQSQRDLMKQDRLMKMMQAQEVANWHALTAQNQADHWAAMKSQGDERNRLMGENYGSLDMNRKGMLGLQGTRGFYTAGKDIATPEGLDAAAQGFGVKAPPGGFQPNTFRDPRGDANRRAEYGDYYKRVSQLAPELQAGYTRAENTRAKLRNPNAIPFPVPGEDGTPFIPRDVKQAMLPSILKRNEAQTALADATANATKSLLDPRKQQILSAADKNKAEAKAIPLRVQLEDRRVGIQALATASLIETRNIRDDIAERRTEIYADLNGGDGHKAAERLQSLSMRAAELRGNAARLRQRAAEDAAMYPNDPNALAALSSANLSAQSMETMAADVEAFVKNPLPPGKPQPESPQPEFVDIPSIGGPIRVRNPKYKPTMKSLQPVPRPKPAPFKGDAAKKAVGKAQVRNPVATKTVKSLKSMTLSELTKQHAAARADMKNIK